ncbi:MAG TPA: phosphodiester glycosidase family protein [Candidatus Krumholzibacteria bacterium]|nr:phosphodiester glycosidase family protein [Candidatus Krumholzibacteria bacterium]
MPRTHPSAARWTHAALLGCAAATAVGCGAEPNAGGARPPFVTLEPGLEVVRRWPEGGAQGRQDPVTLVHVDPARFEMRLLTAAEHGGARPVDRWVEDFDLVAAINASMYLPNERSTGYMVDDERVNNPAVNPRFGGILAFGARSDDVPPFRLVGLECGGVTLEDLQRDYRAIVQNYRLLDCRGEPIPWQDRKLYATAAIGVDQRGWLVLVHSGAPQQTADLARWLAREDWGLVAAHFVEGGHDASLYVTGGRETISVVGRYEGTAAPREFREVPNVLGVVRRGTAR